jgi:hypothetical protein
MKELKGIPEGLDRISEAIDKLIADLDLELYGEITSKEDSSKESPIEVQDVD